METYRVYNSIFYDFTIIISCEQTERELMLSYFDKMDEHYKHSLVQYSDIVQEYKKECKRGSKKENKSLWNPPRRTLGSNERLLLLGPPSSATLLNKLSLRDPVSNRVICYSANW